MIMKRFCLVSLLMLLAFNVRGQENEVEDFNNLIISGIKSYIEEDLNNMIISSIKSYIDDDYNTNYAGNMYKNKDSITYNICVDGLPLSHPFDSIKNICYFSYRLKSKNKEFKKGTSALEIDVRTSDDKFSIGINSVNVIYKRKSYHKKITGRTVYLYAYSQEQKKWILIKKRNLGVSDILDE